MATTPAGVTVPLFSLDHSLAMSGNSVARLLVIETRRLAQNGHPVPRVRLLGFARQRWSSPREQIHQTRRPEPADKSAGLRSPLRWPSHSPTSSGKPSTQYLDLEGEGSDRIVIAGLASPEREQLMCRHVDYEVGAKRLSKRAHDTRATDAWSIYY